MKEVNLNDVVLALDQAAKEIERLRAANREQAVRLDMFDKMMLLFESQPNYDRRGMEEDLAWKLKNFAKEIKDGLQAD